jgi:hypothetical protein
MWYGGWRTRNSDGSSQFSLARKTRDRDTEDTESERGKCRRAAEVEERFLRLEDLSYNSG